MKLINMYASMEIKHATSINQNLFLLFAIQKYICININLTQHAYISQNLLPLFVNHQQGVKVKSHQTNFSPPFCQK